MLVIVGSIALNMKSIASREEGSYLQSDPYGCDPLMVLHKLSFVMMLVEMLLLNTTYKMLCKRQNVKRERHKVNP